MSNLMTVKFLNAVLIFEFPFSDSSVADLRLDDIVRPRDARSEIAQADA